MPDSNSPDIAALVKATIETRILEAFRSTPEIVEDLVKAALSQDVDQFGGEPKYSSERMPYLTYLTRKRIQCIANAAVTEWLREQEPRITEMVKARLGEADVVGALAGVLTTVAKDDWRVKVSFGRDEQ